MNKAALKFEKAIKLDRILFVGYLEVSDGWVSPFNGIQYKYFSDEAANWTSASEFCSNMKGSLPLTTDLDFRLLRSVIYLLSV